MKWNKYRITTLSGLEYEIVLGEWLEEANYDFGDVKKLQELTPEEVEEFHDTEKMLYKMWCEQLSEDF